MFDFFWDFMAGCLILLGHSLGFGGWRIQVPPSAFTICLGSPK